MRQSLPAGSRMASPEVLDDLLLYRLTRLLAVAGGVVVRYCEGRYGITRREWGMLAILAAHGAAGSSELARQAQLDRPRTSRAIGALQAKGLVERTTPGGDARQVRVALTARGRQLYREMFPLVSRFNVDVLSVLSGDEIAQLDDMLARLRVRAEALAASDDLPLADRRHGGSRRLLPSA